MPPGFACLVLVKPWANGRNIVVSPSTPNIVGCYMLRPFAHPVVCRWELLRPFGHHCQHEHNNCQHCWPDNIGSCCVRLDTTANTNATTPNIVGPTILGIVTSVWTPLPTRTLQLPTSLARQSWELLRLVARSLRRFPRPSHSCISVTHPLRLYTWSEMHEATRKRQTCFVFLQHAERRRVLFLKKKKHWRRVRTLLGSSNSMTFHDLFKFFMKLGLVVTFKNFHNFPSLGVFFDLKQFNRHKLWCPPKCVPLLLSTLHCPCFVICSH